VSLFPVTWAKSLLQLASKVQELLELQKKTAQALAKMSEDLAEIRIEIERLKAREELVIEKARSSASAAATAVVVSTVADIASRVGGIEVHLKRLPSPPLGGP
jgi:hypothetical protein